MIRAHKIRLHPTAEQAISFAKAAGTARFVWNWALAEWNRLYEAGEQPTALTLKKQFNAIRREQFPWTWEVTKNASDQPFLDLGKAFTAFFEGRARRPKFKSKKRSKPSFYLANDQFELGDHRIWVVRRVGAESNTCLRQERSRVKTSRTRANPEGKPDGNCSMLIKREISEGMYDRVPQVLCA